MAWCRAAVFSCCVVIEETNVQRALPSKCGARVSTVIGNYDLMGWVGIPGKGFTNDVPETSRSHVLGIKLVRFLRGGLVFRVL